MTDKEKEKWAELREQLRKAVAALAKARADYAAAKPKMDSADLKFVAAVQQAEQQVKEVAEVPPGTFPAITG